MLYHSDEKNFDKVIKSNKKILVDFFAEWCGPCQMIGEELKKLADEKDFDIVKVDIDYNRGLAIKYNVEVVPTMYVFVDGKPIKKVTGYMNKNQILDLMSKH